MHAYGFADGFSANFVLERMGVEVMSGEFTLPQRVVLRLWSLMPSGWRDYLFFSGFKSDMFFQKSLQFCLGGPRPVTMRIAEGNLSGLGFSALTSHKYFLLGTAFERGLQRQLADILKREDIVYDIGSHFGWWTLWFSRRCRQVVAFEPSPTNFRFLHANVTSNGASNVILHNFAASNRGGTVAFVEEGSCSHLGDDHDGNQALPKVEVMRIDDCTGDPPPTFVKVDVEGHAGPVLEGMRSILETKKPCIACELHHIREETTVTAILKDYDYRVRCLEKKVEFPKHIIANAN